MSQAIEDVASSWSLYKCKYVGLIDEEREKLNNMQLVQEVEIVWFVELSREEQPRFVRDVPLGLCGLSLLSVLGRTP